MTTFHSELRRAMTVRGVRPLDLARMVGVSDQRVSDWRHRRYPSIHHAQLLAEALGWPSLLEMIVARGTRRCTVCDLTFVSSSTAPNHGRYCSRNCRQVAFNRREREARAMDGVFAQRRLTVYQAAVSDFCRQCEPEGLCRDSECALRPVSPLRFVAINGRRVA